MRTELSAATLLILFLSAAPLAAQETSLGKLEGTVKETVATRSVRAASVSLVPLESATSVTFNTSPDAQGRFHLDSLPAGRYLVQLNSPTLDSLEMALPPAELRITGGKTARAELALPFGVRLRDAICQGLHLAPGKAAVAGRAIDADSEQPLAGADVVAGWTEITVDKATLKSTTQKRTAVIATGPRGEYRMCGVPTGRWISMQLQHAGRAGAVIRLVISEAEGAVVRDISLSPRFAPTIAALDSVERTMRATDADSSREELQLTGSSTLSGMVRGTSGQPLSDVQVRVRDARSSDVTDSAGHFVLNSLPSGTQVVVVRHLGYAVTEIPVELRAGKSLQHDVHLTRAAVLDSVKVVATRYRLAEFEHNRRTNVNGKFMSLGEIQRRDAKETSELLSAMGGFSVTGRGDNAVVSARGAVVAQPLCRNVNAYVVIDGLEGMSINDVAPTEIEGIEAYPDATSAPAKYADKSSCGLIVLWMKSTAGRSRPSPPRGAGLKGNGYP
jgi:hypothetical protein